jgi:hypothetical protein
MKVELSESELLWIHSGLRLLLEEDKQKKEDSKGDYAGTLTQKGIKAAQSLMDRICDAAEHMMARRIRKIEGAFS